jgi:hypothetical protein
MLPEFDTEERGPVTRVIRRAETPTTGPAQLVVAALVRLTAVLEKLLSRSTTPTVTVPAAEVQVTVPPRPCRKVECTITRDRDGFAKTITFTEMEM